MIAMNKFPLIIIGFILALSLASCDSIKLKGLLSSDKHIKIAHTLK